MFDVDILNDVFFENCLKCVTKVINQFFYRNENPKFVEALRHLESSPICQSLAMHSFLMLPMQRITRLPLLVDAIYNRLNTTSPEYQSCKEALQTLNKVK